MTKCKDCEANLAAIKELENALEYALDTLETVVFSHTLMGQNTPEQVFNCIKAGRRIIPHDGGY